MIFFKVFTISMNKYIKHKRIFYTKKNTENESKLNKMVNFAKNFSIKFLENLYEEKH